MLPRPWHLCTAPPGLSCPSWKHCSEELCRGQLHPWTTRTSGQSPCAFLKAGDQGSPFCRSLAVSVVMTMLQATQPLILALSPGRRCWSTPARKYDLPEAPNRALAVAKQQELRLEAMTSRHQECGGTGSLLLWQGAQLPAMGRPRAAGEAQGGRFWRNKVAQLGRSFPSREARRSWRGTWCCCGLVTSAFFLFSCPLHTTVPARCDTAAALLPWPWQTMLARPHTKTPLLAAPVLRGDCRNGRDFVA